MGFRGSYLTVQDAVAGLMAGGTLPADFAGLTVGGVQVGRLWVSPLVDFKALGVTAVVPVGVGLLANVFTRIWVTEIVACSVSPTVRIGNVTLPAGLCASQSPASFTTAVVNGAIGLTGVTAATNPMLNMADGSVNIEVTVAATATALKGHVFISGDGLAVPI